MTSPENYLFSLEDGLDVRVSQEYARDKLNALEAYLNMAMVSMKNRPWSAFNYIDLQAGPGKNRIGEDVLLGSPLIALNVNPPFTHYWFNELDQDYVSALQKRISQSSLASRVHFLQCDVNEAVDKVVTSIERMDKDAKTAGTWSTFNITFLDPEGLEINWETVEKLARIQRMDMIINFSTGGINRNLHQPDVIDRYFGNQEWREQVTASQPTLRRRQFINVYRKQLERFGYYISTDDSIGYHDISMRNSKNAEVYSLVFASKHQLGDDFWQKIKREIEKIRHGSKPLL
jgi:three-Cys-motif partner protein